MYAAILVKKDFVNKNHINNQFKLQPNQLIQLRQKDEIIIQRNDYNNVDELKDYILYKAEILKNEDIILIKLTNIITLNSDWEDIDNLEDLIAFLICKYYDDIKLIPKIVRNAKNIIKNTTLFQFIVIHTVIYDICEALGKVYSSIDDIKTFKIHITNLFKAYPKRYHDLIVGTLLENLGSDRNIREKYIRAIMKEIRDVNVQIAVLERICHSAFINTNDKSLCINLLLNKIKRNIEKARKNSIIKLMHLSKHFADSKKVIRIIYKQITERLREDCNLMYKFANTCKYRVNELFDYICNNDKSGKYIVLMIEKFPLLDRKQAIDIISKRKDINQELARVLDEIRETYMMSQ